MAKINCSVRSCYYWNEGGICGADSIIVKTTGQEIWTMNWQAWTWNWAA